MDVNDFDFNSKLISLYEAHKVLYDKNYRLDGYTGKLEQVNQAWLEIAYNLELGGYIKSMPEIKERFCTLRRRFWTETSKIIRTKQPSNFRYYNQLSFLLKHKNINCIRRLNNNAISKKKRIRKRKTPIIRDSNSLSKVNEDQKLNQNHQRIKVEDDADTIIDIMEDVTILSPDSNRVLNSEPNSIRGSTSQEYPHSSTNLNESFQVQNADKKNNKYEKFGQYITAVLVDQTDEEASHTISRLTRALHST